MKPEIEATFIDINKDELRKKLKQAGAKLLQPEVLMKRVVFGLNYADHYDQSFAKSHFYPIMLSRHREYKLPSIMD